VWWGTVVTHVPRHPSDELVLLALDGQQPSVVGDEVAPFETLREAA
jgi:hypothetical protein